MGAKKPVYDFTSEDGVQHTLYVVENLMEIAELTRLFEDVPVMYIADGHHRSAAAALVGAEKAKQTRVIRETRSITISWLFASRPTN